MSEKLADKTQFIDPLAQRDRLLADIKELYNDDTFNIPFNDVKTLIYLYKKLVQQDPVTGLANLAGALEHVRIELSAGRRVLVFSVNISGFKEVNLIHSHAVGDLLLSRYAYIISNSFRSVSGSNAIDIDCVGARLHGDQFAIVVSAGNKSQQVPDSVLETIEGIFNLEIDHSNGSFSDIYKEIEGSPAKHGSSRKSLTPYIGRTFCP